MNEFNSLRTLREEVAAPTSEQLNRSFRSLEKAMRRPRVRRHWTRARWAVAVPAGALLVSLVAGNITVSAQSAQAASLLNRVSGKAVTFADPVPGPGEYLLSHTHADWPGYGADGIVTRNPQIIDVYAPADQAAEWVLRRDWGTMPLPGKEQVEIRKALGGHFYGGAWITEDLDAMPLDGEGALAYFDAEYYGGSMSRHEDNFVRIAGVLRSGLVPAPQRAALFEALALIPGVSSTSDVANLDGRVGVAIGRTELLRLGMRQEIIIDPDTGLVIGERSLSTFAVFGFGFNEVISLTAVDTSVVDAAPTE